MMKKYSDKILLISVLLLIGIGLITIFSASSSIGALLKQDFTFFFYHQVYVIIFSIIIFIAGLLIPYQFYRKFSIIFMLTVTLMLIFVLFSDEKKGASRWLNIFGFSIQPAELAKVFLVFHLSRLAVRLKERLRNIKKLLLPLSWIIIIAGLVAAEPNFSNAFIIGLNGIVLLYIGGAKKRHLFGITLVGVILVFVLMWFTPHSHARLQGWLGKSTTGAPSAQVNEALIGMGSGGLTGVGIGKSQQANFFLPEAYNDFIFAILGEELGFIGTVSISFLYILFFLMAMISISQVEDKYGSLIIFGVSFNIVLSAMINMAVVLGLLPTTGITLPFVSYGGSSLLVFVYSIAVILNVNSGGEIGSSILKNIKKNLRWINKIDDAKI